MEAIEKRFGRNTETKKAQKTLLKQKYENFTGSHSESLDQIHDRLQKLVSQLEIHEVSLSQEDVNLKLLRSTTTQNLAFVSSSNTDSTTDSVNATASVSTVCAKMHVSSLPNVDSLSNAWSVITATGRDILLGNVGSFDWSYQVEEEPANFAFMDFSSSSSSFDIEVPSCSKAYSKAYTQLHTQYDKLTADFCKSQFDVISYQTGTFMPPKPDLVFNTAPTTVETNHHAFTVQLSPIKPDQDLSHTTRLATPIIEDWVSNSEDESETKAPQIVPSFVQSFEQVKTPRHSIQPLETSILAATPKPASPKSNSSGKRRNRKACFVSKSVDHLIKNCDYHAKKIAQPSPRNYAHRSKPVSITAVRPVSAAVPKIKAPVVSAAQGMQGKWGNPQYALKDKGVINSGCSRHMTENMSYLSDFEELNGGYVAFGGNPKGGKIFGKVKFKTCKLDFDDVHFVKELKFNLFSVSQMCDKQNSVLFTDTECLVLSPAFKLPDES
nr:ribonuclease H-like domain-containing protein [Tanacetum cinerariifolium]